MALVTENAGRAGGVATAGAATGRSSSDQPPTVASGTARPATGNVNPGEDVAVSTASAASGQTSITGNAGSAVATGLSLATTGLTTGEYVRADATSYLSPVTGTSIYDYRTAAARAIAARAQGLDLDQLLDVEVNAADRVPTFSVLADWNGDGNYNHPLSDLTPVVEQLTVTRETSSDLPESVGLVTGTASTTAEVVIGGQWIPKAPIPAQQLVGNQTYGLIGTNFRPTQFFSGNYTMGQEFEVKWPETQIDALIYWRENTSVTASIGALFDVANRTEVPNTRVTFANNTATPNFVIGALATPFFPEIGKRYKVAILFSYFGQQPGFFTEGDGRFGIDQGPLRIPSATGATGGRQGTFLNSSTFGYPTQGDPDGKCYGVDVFVSRRTSLTGNPKPVPTDPAKAFSPYRKDADLGGVSLINKRLAIKTGMQTMQGPVTLPRLTGSVSGYSVGSQARTVTLQGLDPTDKLRAELSQAAWAISLEALTTYGTVAGKLTINSQWLIDRALRANGYFASPPPGVPLGDSSLWMSMTLHGGPMIEAGGFSEIANGKSFGGTPVPGQSTWTVADHPYKMLAPNPLLGLAQALQGTGAGKLDCTPGNGWAASALIRMPGAGANLSAELPLLRFIPAVQNDLFHMQAVVTVDRKIRLRLTYKASASSTTASNTSVTPSAYVIPATATWMHFGFHWNFTSTGVSFGVALNGTLISTATADIGAVGNNVDYYDAGYYLFTLPGGAGVSMTNVSMWKTNVRPTQWVGASWVPTAKIDVGTNNMYGIPELMNEESYELIKSVTEAELGQFAFDETGFPYFRSRAVARSSVTAEQLTADRSLSDLFVTVDQSTVRNIITFTCSAQLANLSTWIYESNFWYEFYTPANSTRSFELPVPENTGRIFVSGTDQLLVVAGDQFSDAAGNQANRDKMIMSLVYADGINADATGWSINYFLQRISTRRMKFTFSNNTNRPLCIATPAKYDSNGNQTQEAGPGLKIPGRLVDAMPPTVGSISVPISQTKYGRQTYSLEGDQRWRQLVESGLVTAAAVLDWTGSPKPVLAEIDVPHNPRRKLYDQVELVDPFGMGSVLARIAAIKTTYSVSDGARDSLLVRPVSGPPAW